MATKMGPLYANLFMGHFEEEYRTQYPGPHPEFYKRGIALFAVVCITSAVTLSLVMMIKDGMQYNHMDIQHTPIEPVGLFQSMATILFATGGHYAFLTFQNDMKKPTKFMWSLTICYIVLAVMYVPIGVVGYTVYGQRVAPNFLLSMCSCPLSWVILILFTCHQFCGFVITLNPLLQHLEEVLNSTKSFSWKRVVIRSSVVLLLLIVAETVPRFGIIMSLVGGSTNMAIMLIGPPLFYVRLCYMTGDWPKIHIPLHVHCLFLEIIGVGVLIGVVSTYGSVGSLWEPMSFSPPCLLYGT